MDKEKAKLALKHLIEIIYNPNKNNRDYYSKEPLAPASLQALVSNDEALSFKGEASVKIV